MGLLEFSKLPVNTLVGADWKTFKEMTRGQEIAPDKRTKYYLTKSVCRLLSLLAPIQDRRFEEKLGAYEFDHDPVFILGHWRSGTTFVHNIFAQDDNFCYTANLSSRRRWVGLCRTNVLRTIWSWLPTCRRRKNSHCRT